MEDAIRTGRTPRGFAGLLRVPPRGVPGFSQQRPLLGPLCSLLFGLFPVPLLLLKLLCSLRALLFHPVSVRFGLASLLRHLFHRAHRPASPKATLFPKWPAMSRSVWTAPYSGALASGARLRYRRLLLLQRSPLAASRITHHVAISFSGKSRQIPARPANGKYLSTSILHHGSRGSCQVVWTQFPRSCQPQLTGAQHIANAATPLEFVRFAPKYPRSPRSPRPRRQIQMPCPQHDTHAEIRRTLSGKPAGWGDKLSLFRDVSRITSRALTSPHPCAFLKRLCHGCLLEYRPSTRAGAGC